jgi:cysteine dioxygenase
VYKINTVGSITKDNIKNLKSLVNALENGVAFDDIESLKHIEITPEEVSNYAFWNKNHYTRNCISKSKDFELLLLCWEGNQKTKIHGHDFQQCWVNVVKGEFLETLYHYENGEMNEINQSSIAKNESASVEDVKSFHILHNISPDRGMTLHLYMKPIQKCQFFNEDSQSLETVNLSYYSFKGERLE